MNKFGVGHKHSLATPLRTTQAEDIGHRLTTQKSNAKLAFPRKTNQSFRIPPDLFQACE